ncbi:TPA: bifunctional DNA-binding transcriptional regulator/O6-methylguanine-DNA methyltransferase Ada [Yersinia enterocolitica]|nr:bifunctional DNA-binding transcriptional regulator/O6-methylguanine-DNA methyltransferase Ada [Yersinia enterocolitica]ELI8442724.1 bifunctional DNA-binding transcriptional regulator/O6-methylguanine-DNA methyltransferase Ada [Yersinia enterocolitica]ELW8975312.1 bifunctional DNA-binding transcriptional regulator/O6-methylguanine-DNA methyltransferase Ada [Yersinia enterocolitica]HDL6614167.1 bifunctional DNA-binding transcriptional regulator/O6-methylguanine-DNA methyltransferase Ada [Yersin
MDNAPDPRWVAIVNRDKTADGQFVYAVKTTGVYCRPSCSSRQAKVENIEFYADNDAAERAGYRPCKRCRPTQLSQAQQHAEKISQACRLIEQAETPFTLDALATESNLSAFHFHRLFKSITGLTPKAYTSATRSARIRQQLVEKGSVTDAIFEAGYNSNGRFYEQSNQLLGMTPTRYRQGGRDTALRFAVGESSLGAILMAKSELGICAILLGDDPALLVQQLQDKFPQAELIGGDAEFEQWFAQVVGLVEAPQLGLDLPLDIRGTAFQQRVWQALREIPAGDTASYADIAAKIGAPKAVRAVAGACAANMLAVAIPCHRVIRQDGALSGYRWGIERKKRLLEKEQQEAETRDQPDPA